jgi:hypothetical protein
MGTKGRKRFIKHYTLNRWVSDMKAVFTWTKRWLNSLLFSPFVTKSTFLDEFYKTEDSEAYGS